MSALNYNTVIVPPAVGAFPGFCQVIDTGIFFYAKAASTPFSIKFDAGTMIPAEAGFKRITPGELFSEIRFFNFGPNAISVSYYVGDGSVDFVATNAIKVAPTIANGVDISGGAQLAAGATYVSSGLYGTKTRKQITVQNLDANLNTITITDQFGNAMFTLAAGSPPLLLETSDVIIIKNTSAGIVTRVLVSELFYS
jgi:hypothetical protein